MEKAEFKPFEPGELAGVSICIPSRPMRLRSGAIARVPVALANGSSATLGTHRWFNPFPLCLGYVWTDAGTNQSLPCDYLLTDIWTPIVPGGQRTLNCRVTAPRAAGRYTLTVMLIQTMFQWNRAFWYGASSEVRPAQLEVEVSDTPATCSRSINDFEEAVYSQNGEDGILREVFLRLGYQHPFAVEVGAGDGVECNTAMWLRQYGWHGLLIEGDDQCFASIQNIYAEYPGVTAANEFIAVENIIGVFRQNGVPAEFDLLSIDVDGNDYWLWEAVAAHHRPHVVVIEYNGAFDPPRLWVMRYNPNHVYDRDGNRNYHGASLESMVRLGKRLGYAFLGTDSNEINAIFVRSDLLERSGFPEVTAAESHRLNAFARARPAEWTPSCEGPSVEQ